MKSSLLIVLVFGLGVMVGAAPMAPAGLQRPELTLYTLYVLLFLVGIGIGANRGAWVILRRIHLKIVAVPIAIIGGSLAGAAAISLLLGVGTLRQSLAVAAGFGYYSLSSILIGQLSGQELGVVALLANIIREMFTLLFTPLLVRYFGRLAPVAAGGATAMDTTLPIIHQFAGQEYAIVAVFSGIVLTVIVPFLVTFLLTVGA